MISWRDDIFKRIGMHIQRDPINIATRGAVITWWMASNQQILGEIESVIDEEIENEVLGELNSLATIIGADARIENNDPNTQRIIQVIDTFIKEIEQEIDYSNDEDKE